MVKMGFTNKMAVYILGLLSVALMLSFVLAVMSIREQYMGVLACWTACLTPLGVGLDIVLNSTVKKSTAENTSAEGDGIRYRQIVNGGEPSI